MRKARMFAALATTAALALTTFGVATANAEDANNSGLIDGSKQASVTIYKYDGADDTARNNGLSQTIDAGKHNKVKGVTFNLYAVQKNGQDIDLSNTDGWAAIKDMTLTKDNAGSLARNELSGYTLGASPAYTATTDDSGSVTWPNVDKKLYLVTETVTGTPEIYTDGAWKKVTINKKTAPFFLTVPLSTKEANDDAKGIKNGWLYDIKIYPKNEVTTDTISKEMEAPTTTELGGGVDVTWKINLPLGQPADGNAFTSIVLTDELADGLAYTSVNSFKISGGKVSTTDGAAENNTPDDLTVDTDFTVDPSGVTITLTPAGLAKANTHIGGVLTGKLVTKQTKAQAIHNDISGTIDNKTTITTKGNGKDDPGTGGDSNWATVKIKKYQTGHEDVTLKGAEFKFVALTDGTAELKSYKEADLTGKTGDVIGKAKYTTGDDGTVTAKLFVGTKDKSRRVCLVELKAPDGYDLPTENATCFELNAATSDTEVVEKKIANTQSSKLTEVLGQLPATGAAGLVLMTLAGALLIGAGFFAVAANRRREQE